MVRRVAALLAVLVTASCGSCRTGQATLDDTVRDFVRATYAHGVPYDKALALGPAAEPVLRQLYTDPAMTSHRSNIIVTLGILGSAAPVIAVIEAGTGPLPFTEVSLRLDAVMALGYAAHAAGPGSPAVLYLLDGLTPTVWGKKVTWRLSSGADPAEMLRGRAISALGLSGKPEGLQALQSLPGAGGGGRGGGGGAPSPSEQALIAEAIKTNQYIAANGMRRYYETFLR